MSPDDDLGLVRPHDAKVLADLHRQAFDSPWDAEAISALLGQPGVFGVRHAAGFILCRVVLDEAEILTLAVRPEARHRGLGARLVKAVAGLATQQGAERLFLEVAEDNTAARALYDRTGFIQAGRRRGYYARSGGPACDALILSLNLAGWLPTG